MARIEKVMELPLEVLEIGRAQSRVRDVSEGISELAESIRKMGLLEPIIVCPGLTEGKYEVLVGQRRFLAHKELGYDKIMAAILDERVDEITAKVISVTENMVRRDVNRRDLIDVCTWLYKKYSTTRDVAEETGLPESMVREYVKYDRLIPQLKEMVDQKGLDLKTALRAQDAASAETGKPRAEEAAKFADEMRGMTGANQQRLVKKRRENPSISVDEAIRQARTGEVVLITVALGEAVHASLKQFAADEGTKQDDAAGTLITEALAEKGYLGEPEDA